MKLQLHQGRVGRTACGCGIDRRRVIGAAAALVAPDVRGAVAAPQARLIDVHFHLLPPQYVAEAPSNADIMRPWARSPEATLEDMDRSGVGVGMLSFPTPSLWFPGVDQGRRLARLCNDHYADLLRRWPGRFGHFASLPPLGDTDGVLAEIAYAYDTLGVDGVAVTTNYAGRYLGDESFAPVWRELDRRKGVVFVHPADAPCCAAINDGVPIGYGEWPFDTARTVMSLWAKQALAERPNLRFIFSHGGGGLPMIADRIDKFGRAGAAGGPPIQDALAFIDRLYFDVANAAGPAALPAVRGMADPKHILFGSDYPFIPIPRSAGNLARSGLARGEMLAIARSNALDLFPRLRRAA